MPWVANILVAAVAILHTYFMYLEMVAWTKPRGLKVFRQTREQAEASRTLAANQGLYNGFLAVGLVWGMIYPDGRAGLDIQIFFLACVMAAGLYGAATVQRKILFIQFAPAFLATIVVILNKLS